MKNPIVIKSNKLFGQFVSRSGHTPSYVNCVVRFKGENRDEEVTISFNGYDEDNDKYILCYCYDIDDFNALMKRDNGEDFVVIDVINFTDVL